MGQIYLVRHGQASFGAADYDQLSPLGVEQGRLLGEWFAKCGQGFDRVMTGGMLRHRQTAEACLGVLPPALRSTAEWGRDVGFNEYDHEEVLIRHHPAFAEPGAVSRFLAESDNAKRLFQQLFQAAVARWMDGAHDAEYTEPWPVFRSRCVAALERVLAEAAPSQNIVIFTSGGTISTLCQQVLGLQDKQVAELNWALVNSAVTKLFYQPGKLSLSYLNNYAHLEWLGEKNAVTYR